MRVRWVLAGVSGVAVLLGSAGPASAAPITYELGDQPVVAGTQDAAQADCPPGARVLGGGVVSSGGYDTSYVNSSYPADGPDTDEKQDDAWRAYVDAFENVTVTARTACVSGGVADNLKYRETARDVRAGKTKSATASCPNGYKVTGGGVQNSANFDDAELKTTRPVAGGTAWKGTIQNFGTHKQEMFVTAICAKGGFAKDLVYRDSSKHVPAHDQRSVDTDCPGTADVVSGGVQVEAAASNVNSTSILASASRSYVDSTGNSGLRFTNYLICAG